MDEKRFKNGMVVWLGDMAPAWANEIENQRGMETGRPFLPFNGYGRVLSQFDDTVEIQVMVGQPFGCWDGRVFRVDADELLANQSADIQKWCNENGWDGKAHKAPI